MDATTVVEEQPTGEVAEVEAPTGLPSDNVEDAKTPWERAVEDGYLKADSKQDPYELAKELANANKYVQEANAEKAKAGKAAQQQETQEATQAEILSMVPEFMENDMQLTPEMETRATELGIDIRDLKLGAIDFRDKINTAYSVVGGKENYTQMMADMAPTMSEEQRKSFDADLGGNASEWAIKGLYAEWKAKNGTPAGRIEGRVGGSSSAKPYESQGELLKDLTYLRTAGKGDMAARALHEKRKAATPDAVVYGR